MEKKIMVLDDDEQIRQSLLKLLRAEGYEVVLAAEGMEALDKLEHQSVDLLLLDLNLPNKSGWDVFERVTSTNSLLPIIIITGREKQSELAVAAGVGALMQKPLDVPLLLKTISELLMEPPEKRLKRLVGIEQSTRCFKPASAGAFDPQVAPTDPDSVRSTSSFMKKSVLIADGEPRCYSQLRNKLIANNCDVFHAASIEDAVKHFDIKTADLLLVDLDVPGERIRSDLSKVSQLNPRIRIIGVTERSEGSEIAVRERLDGVAEKPFALGNLITFVHELLSNPSPWTEFCYLPPRMPGLHAGASQRPHRVLDYPVAYSGWGINE